MKHKTAELEGALLDAAGAKIEGVRVRWNAVEDFCVRYRGGDDTGLKERRGQDFMPSRDWSLGGQIIERERIAIIKFPSGWVAKIMEPHEDYIDTTEKWERRNIAPTPLIAAMRAFVASKLGEEVEL